MNTQLKSTHINIQTNTKLEKNRLKLKFYEGTFWHVYKPIRQWRENV